MYKKIAAFLLFFSLFLAPSFAFAAYSSGICDPTGKCTEGPTTSGVGNAQVNYAGVGPFLKDISGKCGNNGDCELKDIMIVISNVGNFILGIVGSFVLLFYVLGGFWYLASHGDESWVKKGKDAIKKSTFGLIVVMFAYIGIQALYSTLTTGDINNTYAVCDGANNGKTCGSVSSCQQGGCYVDGGLLVKSGYDKASAIYDSIFGTSKKSKK